MAFKKATPLQRIKFLRKMLWVESETHGSPCMCIICEALIFDAMFANGERDIKSIQWEESNE